MTRRAFTTGRNALSWTPVVIGLTGSIGMGKSTAANMARRMGVAVFDADAEVHRLMGPQGKALAAINEKFPGVVGSKGVDRQALGQMVFGDTAALKDLEALLHPLVRQSRQTFLRAQSLRRARCVLLDIPLLLESPGASACDLVLVVSAPSFLQRDRVLRRPGMTLEKFNSILGRQMSDQKKRRRADEVLHSGMGKHVTWRMLHSVLRRRVMSPKEIHQD